jgi:hypothetical protein
MTSFVTTDIPTQINTLERLAAWVALALQRVNPTLSIIEQSNAAPERTCQAVLATAEDDTVRLVARISIEIDPDYAESTSKLWLSAREFSNTTLPAAFKVN